MRLSHESHPGWLIVQVSGVLREVKANRRFVSKGEAVGIKARKSASGGGDRDIKQKTE